MPASLGITRSLTGRQWLFRAADERVVDALAAQTALPELVCRILAGRGLGDHAIADFLNPTLRQLLPEPYRLQDMQRGAEHLAGAVARGEQITIFGDYDVDGATAAALLFRFLSAVGNPPSIYVPDRLKEGYGPNAEAMLRLKANGTDLVVTVDCGIAAIETMQAAETAGLDVIIVDHHQSGDVLPPAIAVINPNRRDETGELGYLAAVGVAFLLVVATNRELRRSGWYASRAEPDLRQWLDLVALGTVCDMVPLEGVNRAFVLQGLKVMARRGNAGMRAIAEVSAVGHQPSVYDLGFRVGPRINAGGRVGRADLGARLLATDDIDLARQIASRLELLNRERQQIEQAVLGDATAQLKMDKAVDPDCLVWASGRGWHPGVIGIVASRLVERFHRPAIVVSINNGVATASCRSIPGVDLGQAVRSADEAGFLIKGGGHAMAAGFTVATDRLDALSSYLAERLRDQAPIAAAPLYLDGTLTVTGATDRLAEELTRIGPFGSGNPEPRFVVPHLRVVRVSSIGLQHLRCTFADSASQEMQGIAFRSAKAPLGLALSDRAGAPLHVAGRLQLRLRRGGPCLQFVIDDAAAVF